LKISAISPDGVIEAAEHKTYPKMFLLTQFHPECDASKVSVSMIKNLINSIAN
jgi:gamma-glutamyl-gamma-aminobutyrate hydrolase PuuD